MGAVGPMSEPPYSTVIERGTSPINDHIIGWLKLRIVAPWIDIGCNTGWLLSEVPGGVGVDASPVMVAAARAKGLDAHLAYAESLPFRCEFETAVLSCVLEQCSDPLAALAEARRVARRVIGVNPIPGSPWGVAGRGCVRSVIPPALIESMGGTTEQMDKHRYFFEIK